MKKMLMSLVGCALLVGCQSPEIVQQKEEPSIEQSTSKALDQLQSYNIQWSHLVDEASRQYLKERFEKVGIQEVNQQFFWNDVDRSLQYFDTTRLVQQSFERLPYQFLEIDPNFQYEKWEEEQGEFIGYNCRITSYGLLRDLLVLPSVQPAADGQLFMDRDAIETSPDDVFNDEQLEEFKQLFSKVETDESKEIEPHLEKIQHMLKERKIEFPKGDVSIGTVWLHAMEDEGNFLFVGHTGIIFEEEEGRITLLEKVSFQEPYQLMTFPHRQALNDYWMTKYDVNQHQPMAKPIILENDQLIEGYRPNLDNPS